MQCWRRKLSKNDSVDAYVICNEETLNGWAQATITKLDGDKVTLQFNSILPEGDQIFDRWSEKLAPFESMTKDDYAWRERELLNCKDKEVDAHYNQYWYKSTILNTEKQNKAGRDIHMAHVAFRVYREA